YVSINNNNYDGFSEVASSVKRLYNDKIRMIGNNDTNGNGDSGAIRNYPKYVSIYGFKANANGTSQLSGATIGLFKKADIDTFKKNNPNATYAQTYTSARAIATCVSGSVKTPFNETKDGCYRFDNLEFGRYVIAEIKAPDGYKEPTEDTIRTIIVNDALYNSCTKSFTINGLKNNIVQVNQLTSEEGKSDITNTPSTGSITVYKVDKNGNPLDGAIFGLYKAYKDGNLRTEYPTDFPAGDVFKRVLVQDGEAVFADIPFGEYFVVELKPSVGFKLPNGVVGKDGKFYSTVTLNNAVKVNETTRNVVVNDVVNEPISVTIKAKKVDEKGNPLAGATFELFDKYGNSLETVISDADGIVNFSTVLTTVSSNYYEIKETKAPFGYRPSEIYFRVIPLSNGETKISKFKNGASLGETIETSDQDALLEFTTFVNEPILGYFDGEKLNENKKPLAGVKFGLYVLENETMTLIEETVTDVNGHFEFDELRIDKKYILKEEKTIDGYIKTDNEWLVTFDTSGWANIEIYKESDTNYSIDGNYVTIHNYPNELIGFKYENEIVYTDDSKTCIDTSKNALKGMYFYLRKKDGAIPVGVRSDENGLIKLSKISD
ncbi:MAG: SpaA isopeptide-forming pilin-related protein, partial [Bacteroidales bacterium]|nr:SpaA isopeptide-forming pilin-related protein [Bacteroidales bacterium]